MTTGLLRAASMWFTLAAVAAYAVTFYLANYNEIHYAEIASYDDSDLPYTLAIVECCMAGATFVMGTIAFGEKPSKRVLFIVALFFGLGVLLEGVVGIVRATNLGIFGGEESTCLDTSLSGCPTTRYEALNDEIQFLSPSGGDCQFWFWGPDMQARYTGAAACNGYGETDGGCGPMIETYMDWTRPSSYGWRDDPADVSAATEGSIATIDKIHNMKYLFAQQSAIGNVSIPTGYAYTKQPSIAGCWYWGCSAVCQPHRFRVNRWWLVSSLALFVLYMIAMATAWVAWRREPRGSKGDKLVSTTVLDVESAREFSVPEMGRRKRRLVQNPTMLQF